MLNNLFVYGSLRSECDNAHVRKLKKEAKSLGHASVRGSLFRVGEFSGYRREPDGVVHGEIWQLPNPALTFAELDGYEGAEYNRIAVPAFLSGESGETSGETIVDVWIYMFAGSIAPEARISSGNFLAP